VSYGPEHHACRKRQEKTTPQATLSQLPVERETEIPSEVLDLIGGGGWTRTLGLVARVKVGSLIAGI
jgi:hypothetical protein